MRAKDNEGRTPLDRAETWVKQEDELRVLLGPGEDGRLARAELALFTGKWAISGIETPDPRPI